MPDSASEAKPASSGVAPRLLAGILFGGLRNGASYMQFLSQVPADVISMIQGLILLFVAADQIIRYIYRIKVEEERLVLTRGWGA